MNNQRTPSARSKDREQLFRSFTAVFEDIDGFLAETNEEKREEGREHLEPLCFMRRIEYTIQMAWGGPEYGFKLSYDLECKEWTRGLFYWADWFKYEEEPLSPEELQKVIEAYSMDGVVP